VIYRNRFPDQYKTSGKRKGYLGAIPARKDQTPARGYVKRQDSLTRMPCQCHRSGFGDEGRSAGTVDRETHINSDFKAFSHFR
jgi:hypothetical protein